MLANDNEQWSVQKCIVLETWLESGSTQCILQITMVATSGMLFACAAASTFIRLLGTPLVPPDPAIEAREQPAFRRPLQVDKERSAARAAGAPVRCRTVPPPTLPKGRAAEQPLVDCGAAAAVVAAADAHGTCSGQVLVLSGHRGTGEETYWLKPPWHNQSINHLH